MINLRNSVESSIIVGKTSNIVNLSFTGFGLLVVAIAVGSSGRFVVAKEISTRILKEKGLSDLVKYSLSRETRCSMSTSIQKFRGKKLMTRNFKKTVKILRT